MNARPKKLAVTLIIIVVLLCCASSIMKIAISSSSNSEIDLFTQKEPYCGKGPDVPSDAFGPGEEVNAYALVTHAGSPVKGILVTFEILGPENPVENITFYRSACTNESGITMISFRVSYLNEITFGVWTVIGTARIGDLTFQDSISFKVGWIVKIVSIRTMNEEHVDQENFTRRSYVGAELALQSIAMAAKRITLTITVYDSLGICVNSTETNDFVIQPNGTLVHFHCFLHIPKSANVGTAVIHACAYTASVKSGGVPYCPEVSRYFLIISRDIAIVSVQPSLTFVYEGEFVNIDVGVKNKGWKTESFNVRVCYNETLIDTMPVLDLKPFSNVSIRFVWDTNDVEGGLYLITASVDPVPYEIDLFDNVFEDGFVEVKLPFHDIAVLNVASSSTLVYTGETVDVCVVVKNQGNYTESFNVTASYNNNDIETKLVENLEPNTEKTLIFHWNTQDVQEGNYGLSALASLVREEVNFENNLYVDGIVEVKAKPPELIIHDVAISTVSPYSNFTYVGEILEIFVIVKNHGNATESFNVTAFYDKHIIGILLVENLEPNSQETLVFQWDTWNVAEGNYTLSARASKVLGEENLKNNSYEDDIVTVVKAPMGRFVPYWFCWLLLLLLTLIIILLIAWYYSRKRRKRAEEAFYSGWTAWYYGYDLRNRITKT